MTRGVGSLTEGAATMAGGRGEQHTGGSMGDAATSRDDAAGPDDAAGGDAAAWARCAVVLEAADPPRTSRMGFWNPDGEPLPSAPAGGTLGELTVALPRGGSVVTRTVPTVLLPVTDALPLLVRARRDAQAHPAAAFWGAAALVALQLVARGRLVPAVSPRSYDAWRVGPLELGDLAGLRDLVAAMPPSARAVVGAGHLAGRARRRRDAAAGVPGCRGRRAAAHPRVGSARGRHRVRGGGAPAGHGPAAVGRGGVSRRRQPAADLAAHRGRR